MPELPERLREAADAYRPDRERMLARVERGIAAPGGGASSAARERSPAPWMRVTAVAAAVAGAVGIGSLAVGAVGGDNPPGQSAVTSHATHATHSAPPRPEASGTSGPAAKDSPASVHHGTAHARRPQPGARHTAGHPAGSAPSSRPGTSTAPAAGGTPRSAPPGHRDDVTATASVDPHSNPYWTEDDVDLTCTGPLTSLTVEVRVSGGRGPVSDNSSFTSAPGMTATVSVDGPDLLYRWTLDPGRTLPPGTYTFAGQFTHAVGDRSTTDDRFTISAIGQDGPTLSGGGF